MADSRFFFMVEYPYAAYNKAHENAYLASKDAFVQKFRDEMNLDSSGTLGVTEQDYARLNLNRRLQPYGHELSLFEYESDNLASQSLLHIQDLPIAASVSFDQLSVQEQATYPDLDALRSPYHRFWGIASYARTVDTARAVSLTRCLTRAIFFPCRDKDTSVNRCPQFDNISFAEMTTPLNNGNYILGVFRWAAWRLRDSMAANGNPFERFIANGAGGGDH
jgi:hypothetical protein